MNKESIRAAIRAVVPKIQECYETWLRAAPEHQSKSLRIKTDFTIVAKDGEGRIDEGEATPVEADGSEVGSEAGSLKDVTLRSCLLQALTTARFPVPPGEGRVHVKYPFLMRSGKSATR